MRNSYDDVIDAEYFEKYGITRLEDIAQRDKEILDKYGVALPEEFHDFEIVEEEYLIPEEGVYWAPEKIIVEKDDLFIDVYSYDLEIEYKQYLKQLPNLKEFMEYQVGCCPMCAAVKQIYVFAPLKGE